MNYTELQTRIIDWIDHSSITDEKARQLIELTESEINRTLRVQQMIVRAQQLTVPNRPRYTLPIGWLGGRTFRFMLTGTVEGEVVCDGDGNCAGAEPEGNQWIDLIYVTPDQSSNISQIPSVPWAYTIEGCDFVLLPTPNAYYPMEILYYKEIPTLSDEEPTNWLLTRAPDLYLWGALAKAESFLRNDERIAVWKQQYVESMESIRAQDSMDRWSHGSLRVRAM